MLLMIRTKMHIHITSEHARGQAALVTMTIIILLHISIL